MNFKFVVMSSLVVFFASGSVFAKQDAKSKAAVSSAANKKSEKTDRKVACDPSGTADEVLANMIVSQVLKGKMLDKADPESNEAYAGFKKILQGLEASRYHVDKVDCSGVLNGGSACVLRVVIPDDESWPYPHDLEVRTSRDGKVVSAVWKRVVEEQPGVG